MHNCGFYHVKGSENSTITSYVGKGGEQRAKVSMKNRGGEVVEHFEVTKGVAGLSVDKTALVFEQFSIEKLGGALSKNSESGLKNAIQSPGAKIYKTLNKEQKAQIRAEYNKLIKQGGSILK